MGVLIVSLLGFGAYWFFTHSREPDDPLYKQIVSHLRLSQLMPVSVSPDGNYFLTKGEVDRGFSMSVVNRHSGLVVVEAFSRYRQIGGAWRPDSQAVAFEEVVSEDKRSLYLLDLQLRKKVALNAPVSETALPPIRWNPVGSDLAYFHGDLQDGRLLIVDGQNSARPKVVINSLAGDANTDFVWSPDGNSIATVSDLQRGSVSLTSLSNAQTGLLLIPSNAEVRDLAWSPDGKSLLAAVRGDGDEYFKLVETEIKTGKVSLRAETQGDISHPLWLPDAKAFLYTVNSNGIVRAYLGDRENSCLKQIGPGDGVLRISHLKDGGGSVYARYTSLQAPPILCELPLAGGPPIPLYTPPNSDQCKCVEPQFIRITASDGTVVPSFHWQAAPKNGHEPTILIFIHGGYYLQILPAWQSLIEFFTKTGCQVIEVNYRSSSGYGQRYEQKDGSAALDIVAAWDYALNTLKIAPQRVFLMGSSRGAGLAAAAAAGGRELGGLILISWPGSAEPPGGQLSKPFPIFEFHGEDDPIFPAAKAAQAVQEFLTPQSGSPVKVQGHIFKDEGHNFNKISSYALIYWETLKLMQLN